MILKWFDPYDSSVSLKDLVEQYLQEPRYTALKDKLAKIGQNARAILSNLKLFNNTKRSIQQINDECQQMIIANQPPELIASHAIYHVTKSVHNKYFYGFVDNLKNTKKDLLGMLKWLFEDFHNTHPKGIKFLQAHDEFQGVHRSGWDYAISLLRQFQSPTGILTDLYTDGTFHWNEHLYAAQGIIPFKQPWIGFIHHTAHPTYNEYNLQNLFKKETFLLSLNFCKAIITLSEQNRHWISKQLSHLGYKIPVFKLSHPTEYTPSTFQYYNFAANPRIIQIGSWLRDPYAIYHAPILFGKKFILIGKNMDNIKHPESISIKLGNNCSDQCDCHDESNHHYAQVSCDCYFDSHDRNKSSSSSSSSSSDSDDDHQICRPHIPNICQAPSYGNICVQFILRYLWKQQAPSTLTVLTNNSGCDCGYTSPHYSQQSHLVKRHEAKIRQLNATIKRNYQSVTTLEHLNNIEYDRLLSSSVVFLKLEDCAAVNTIIECIIRNTPIIVNRLPATIEYLGANYPLFYDSINDVSKFTIKNIQTAHKYLSKMDKTHLMADTFTNGFKSILNEIEL